MGIGLFESESEKLVRLRTDVHGWQQVRGTRVGAQLLPMPMFKIQTPLLTPLQVLFSNMLLIVPPTAAHIRCDAVGTKSIACLKQLEF